MSTTIMCQGHNGHSSSRVLAPPGGKSSIFSFGEPDAKPAAKAPAPKSTSSVFPGHENATPATSAKVNPHAIPAAATYTGPSHPRLTSNLAGNDAVGSAPVASRPTQPVAEPAASTAQGKTRDVYTSSRVLNPPGGKSSIAFF